MTLLLMEHAASLPTERPPLRRLPDWEMRLRHHVEANRRTPFAYGQHDCCLFGLSCIDAMCGTTLADEHRGQYSDAAGALAYLAAHGWRTSADAARAILGKPLESWGEMRPGDILHYQAVACPPGTLLVCAPSKHPVLTMMSAFVGPGLDKLTWVHINHIPNDATAFAVGVR